MTPNPISAHDQRREAAKRRAERHRREAAYYERLMQQEAAKAHTIEATWRLDSPGEPE